MTVEQRRREFIDWLKPMAEYIQITKGIPAAISIAQAIQETGWGRSDLFRAGRALFGQICGRSKRTSISSVSLGGQENKFTGRCIYKTGDGQMSKTFARIGEGYLSYVRNLFSPRHSYYKDFVSLVNKTKAENPYSSPDWQEALVHLKNYNGSNYLKSIKGQVNLSKNRLKELEQSPCQKCLEEHYRRSGAAAPSNPWTAEGSTH